MEKKYAADAKIPLKQKVKNILRNALLRKNNGGGTSNVKNSLRLWDAFHI